MRELPLVHTLFVSSLLIIVGGAAANSSIRRDDGGQHAAEESSTNDSVEFVQHVAEREEKTHKLAGASPIVAPVVAHNPSRHLLEQLDELVRLQNMQTFAAASANDHARRERLMSSFDYFARSLLTRKTFQIECCRGGYPQITHPELARNFTYNAGEYLTDETEPLSDGAGELVSSKESSPAASGRAAGAALNCRMYYGAYMTPPAALLSFELSSVIQIVCKCPDIGPGHQLDNNCRRLPICKNNGFRSSMDPQKCLCLQPFFGDKCEKFCDRGQRIHGLNGRDYCSCSPFYIGDECRELVCMNGGREENGRCVCPLQYLGYHCEIDTNRTKTAGGHYDYGARTGGAGANDNTRFQRFGDHVSNEMFTRDISGTIFSLIMIIVLVVSMYLLMKHRMQTRYLNRRPDLLNACNFSGASALSASGGPAGGLPTTARRIELMPTFNERTAGVPTSARTFPFCSFMGSLANTFIPGDGGPPPYIAPGQRSRRNRDEVLPPLPSYEDATKLPPLRSNVVAAEPTVERDAATVATTAVDRPMEMVMRRQDAATVTRTTDETPPDNEIAARRQRPSRYTPHDDHDGAEAQGEAVALRSADEDGNPSASTHNAITTTGTQGLQNFSPSDNKRHKSTTSAVLADDNNRSQKKPGSKADNKRKSSDSGQKQQQNQQLQRCERSSEVDNEPITTSTVASNSRHTAV